MTHTVETLMALADAVADAAAEYAHECSTLKELEALIAAKHNLHAALTEALAAPQPILATKTWFEDGVVMTKNLTAKDIYKEESCNYPECECATESPCLRGFPQAAQTVREQEPVAWAVVGEGGYDRLDGHKQFIGLSIQKPVTFFGSTAMPLYAAPQGAPKPLTPEQIKEGYLEHDLKYAFVSSAWSFTAGVEFAEAAHGIGGGE